MTIGTIDITEKNLKIIYNDDKDYKNLWSSFLKNYKQYSYKYVLDVIDYYLLISNESLNKSFLVKSNDEIIAICPLILEKVKTSWQASIYNGKDYIPLALLSKKLTPRQKSNVEKILFMEIKKNLKKLKAKKAFFQADSISLEHNEIFDTFLDKEQALDISTFNHIVNLTLTEEELWKQIRKSSKSIINKGLEIFDFKVFDNTNFYDELGELHQKMHHELAGKITRPIKSFKKMSDWVKRGCAIFIKQSYKKKIAQLAFVAIGGKSAAHASVVENLNINPPVPMTHSLNFFIYKEVKRRGVDYYDVGLTAYRSSLFYNLSKKEININHFKRGFGNRSFPLRLWIWFEDRNEEIQFIKEKFKQYEKNKD